MMSRVRLYTVENVVMAGAPGPDGVQPIQRTGRVCPYCLNDGFVTLDAMPHDVVEAAPCPRCKLGEFRERKTQWWAKLTEMQMRNVGFDGGVTVLHEVCKPCTVREERFRLHDPDEGCLGCKRAAKGGSAAGEHRVGLPLAAKAAANRLALPASPQALDERAEGRFVPQRVRDARHQHAVDEANA